MPKSGRKQSLYSREDAGNKKTLSTCGNQIDSSSCCIIMHHHVASSCCSGCAFSFDSFIEVLKTYQDSHVMFSRRYAWRWQTVDVERRRMRLDVWLTDNKVSIWKSMPHCKLSPSIIDFKGTSDRRAIDQVCLFFFSYKWLECEITMRLRRQLKSLQKESITDEYSITRCHDKLLCVYSNDNGRHAHVAQTWRR